MVSTVSPRVAHRLRQIAPEVARARNGAPLQGSGASMCALDDGRSIESTLGFTALDGLPMGTRPGQLDPGVVLYLYRGEGNERGRRSGSFLQGIRLEGSVGR